MSSDDLFRRIIGVIEGVGIPYMLTGSFASSYHGTPRATQDIDVVIAPTREQIRALVIALPETEYYVDMDTALAAQKQQGQFNIVDLATGWKVDLIVRRSRAFSRAEFDRREFVDFHGLRLAIATAEDILLVKLEWAKIGASERQINDAAGILRTRSGHLEMEYLRHWVEELELQDQWDVACRISGLSG